MEKYNKELCQILIEINNYVNNTIGNSLKDAENIRLLQSKLQNIDSETCIKEFQKSMGKLDYNCEGNNKSLYCKLKTSIQVLENNLKSDNSSYKTIYFFNKLKTLDNKIQNETINLFKKYNNNNTTVLDEQNSLYENVKFNNTYLFLFNISIVLIIIGTAFYKKTY